MIDVIKKTIALTLAALVGLSVLSGCKNDEEDNGSGANGKKGVTISVVTSFGGDDGNRQNYEKAYQAFEKATGNKVSDNSQTSNETWKSQVMADFQTGAEPDVLFYFNGVDSNKLIQDKKVVSIDEIREVYPDYADNMKDDWMGASPVDGKNYSVPVNGFWELLFVNKKVLSDCGVDIPGADYTWEQFLKDCETIKQKGYTPIAASLFEVPHYWFEYTVFNHGNPENHLEVPSSATDAIGKKWQAGMEDIKTLFSKGFFPSNTLTAKDADTFQLLADGKAAFAIDGSWKLGWFTGTDNQAGNVDNIDDFTICFVPGSGERKATDIIGGISMGYYITRKAWDDPNKQKACVDFVEAMTTDEVVSAFGVTNVTALKNGTIVPDDVDSMTKRAIDLMQELTATVPAVQDQLTETARKALFADIQNVVSGKMTAQQAIASALDKNK